MFLIFVSYSQETLLVHKDLAHSSGLNELIVELRVEGTVCNGVCVFLISSMIFMIFYCGYTHPRAGA